MLLNYIFYHFKLSFKPLFRSELFRQSMTLAFRTRSPNLDSDQSSDSEVLLFFNNQTLMMEIQYLPHACFP